MGSAERAAASGEPPEIMVLEEMLECREIGCLLMLLDLSTHRIEPTACFPRYLERIDEAFAEREAELEVPYITKGRAASQRLKAVQEARRRYRERAASLVRRLVELRA